MSSATSLARRYAHALWTSVENGDAEKLLAGLELLSEAMNANAELKNLALSPAFGVEEKLKVFSEIFEKTAAPQKLRDFLTLLLQRERVELLTEITEAYRMEYLQASKVKEALVETAFDLSEKEKEQISKVLEAALDSRVQLEVKVVPSLIAGLRVDVDGKTIDATIRANVELLKQELLQVEA
jgi:F-type H+-transporting ATPase subunit delta